jgi:alpha-1,6-mannosyltransferase
MRAALSRAGWAWASLGLAGSVAVALAGARVLRGSPVVWWFDSGLPAPSLVFWVGVAALCAAWLGVGRRNDVSVRALWLIGALWCAPLLLAPAVFSRDMYSYLADGTLLHHGLNPYHQAPASLAQLHDTRLLDAVSPFWRQTTAPYGPAFLGVASVIAGIVGSNLVAGVLLLRLVEFGGVVLLAIFVPRLARRLGADPARAVWLAVISPLVVLELIGAGHNDALMAGLLVAGVTLSLERRPLLGIALCALAATVKLPAAVAIVLIVVSWARAEPQRVGRIVALGAAVAGAVLAAVSVITGLGLDWIAGSLSTPAKVRIAITPATALGHTATSVLHGLGASTSSSDVEHALAAVALALTAALAIWLCVRVRRENLVWYLGLLLLACVFGGPAAWPWYGIWGLALLACCPGPQRWRWLPAVLVVTAFLVNPDGQLMLSRQTSPLMLALYALAAGLALRRAVPRSPRVTPEFAR